MHCRCVLGLTTVARWLNILHILVTLTACSSPGCSQYKPIASTMVNNTVTEQYRMSRSRAASTGKL
jgi:hypothetical protein